MGLGGNSGIDFDMWASKGLTISQQYDFVEAHNCLKKVRRLIADSCSTKLLKLIDDCITESELEGNIESDETKAKRKQEYAETIEESLK